MQFFAEELIPYFEIKGKVKRFAPTELVRLELRTLGYIEVVENQYFAVMKKSKGLQALPLFLLVLIGILTLTAVTPSVFCCNKEKHFADMGII